MRYVELYLTCNIFLGPRCFCTVVLQTDSLNFRCAWLSGRVAVLSRLQQKFGAPREFEKGNVHCP